MIAGMSLEQACAFPMDNYEHTAPSGSGPGKQGVQHNQHNQQHTKVCSDSSGRQQQPPPPSSNGAVVQLKLAPKTEHTCNLVRGVGHEPYVNVKVM